MPSGGENVYPAEIENVLYELKEIREVAVIGVPDERFGETGCAVVALQEGVELSPDAIMEHCRPRLARLPEHRDARSTYDGRSLCAPSAARI